MRKKHLFTSFALITALSVQMLAPTMGQPAMATTKMKLNKTSASIKVGKKVTLKVVGCKKSVSWSTNNMQDLASHICSLAVLRSDKHSRDDITAVALKISRNRQEHDINTITT